MKRCNRDCCIPLLVGFGVVALMWLLFVFMTLMWSSYVPATCIVTSNHVDVRVCSCKNPYVGVATFLVQSRKYSTYNFTLDVSCEPTYDDAWNEAAAVYEVGKTYDCLYNDRSVMWPKYQQTVMFNWFILSIALTGAYAIFIVIALVVGNKRKC